MSIGIDLGRVLSSTIGVHYPSKNKLVNVKSIGNLPNLAAIAMWLTNEVMLDGKLSMYMNDYPEHAKTVASGHVAIALDMLDVMNSMYCCDGEGLVEMYAREHLDMVRMEN